MKKISTYLSLIIFSFFISSCVSTMKFSDLHPEKEIKNKLPSLKPYIDITSLESAYSKGTSKSNFGAYTSKGLGGYVTLGVATTRTYADKRVNDALIYIERDIKSNITNYLSEPKGKILIKISNSESLYKPKMGRILLGSIPLGIPVLAGLNVYSHKVIIELDVEIRNLSDTPVARYIVVGKGETITNIYTVKDSKNFRKPNILAIKDAMDKLKIKIESDYNNIVNKL